MRVFIVCMNSVHTPIVSLPVHSQTHSGEREREGQAEIPSRTRRQRIREIPTGTTTRNQLSITLRDLHTVPRIHRPPKWKDHRSHEEERRCNSNSTSIDPIPRCLE